MKERRKPLFESYLVTEKDLGLTQLTIKGMKVRVVKIRPDHVGKTICVNLNRR